MKLEAIQVSFSYSAKGPQVLSNIHFSVEEGERVGLIAPSGYGKTSFVKLLAGYEAPTTGQVLLGGKPLPKKGFCPVQLICQHPEKAINPRWKMRRVLEEAGQNDPAQLAALGIEKAWLSRFPRELSGGELQRFCVARALAQGTRFLIADEMSTMLDGITQAQIWQYVLAVCKERGIALVALSHNPALLQRVATKVIDLQALNSAPPLL